MIYFLIAYFTILLIRIFIQKSIDAKGFFFFLLLYISLRFSKMDSRNAKLAASTVDRLKLTVEKDNKYFYFYRPITSYINRFL
jgi:hypothetical protein